MCHKSLISCLLFLLEIDECLEDIDDCDALATCMNTVGSFTCACNSGYQGPGNVCTGECNNQTLAKYIFNFQTYASLT